MGGVIGLDLREEVISGVVLRRGPFGTRVQAAFTLPAGETTGEALRAKLRELRVRARRVHVGLPRRWAIVKPLDLPPAREGDLTRLVGFELERHLPFPPEEAVYDFAVLERRPGRPVRVLLVALERRTLERVLRLLKEAGLVPRLVDVGVHSLAAQGAANAGRAIVHLRAGEGELAVVRRGRLLLSRAFPLPSEGDRERGQALAEEIQRSLGTLPGAERAEVSQLALTGEEHPADSASVDLAVAPSPVVPPGLERQLAGFGDGRFLPALGMALRRPRRGPLRTNLLPEGLRPRPFPVLPLVTVGLLLLSFALALAGPVVTTLRTERYLRRLDRTVARVAPQVKEVERGVVEVEQLRREIQTLRGFRERTIHPLPALKELTDLVPGDAWLINLALDRQGVELAGFATAASQLIPLLEGSPVFERVQFTSPVTRGVKDKEQFRLRASWERLPSGIAEAPPADRRGTP